MTNRLYIDIDIEFEDVKFLRATAMIKESYIDMIVMIQHGTGRFEVAEGKNALVTGYVREISNSKLTEFNHKPDTTYPILQSRDFYKELRLRGYHYKDLFRQVQEARGDGSEGKIKWEQNFVAYMDCMLQIGIVGKDSRSLMLPTSIERMTISHKLHREFLKDLEDEEGFIFDVKCDRDLRLIQSGGIEIKGLQAMPVTRRKPPGDPVLERCEFIPHLPTPKMNLVNALRVAVQIALENFPMIREVKAVEVDAGEVYPPLIESLQLALGDLPLITSDLHFLTSREVELSNINVSDGHISVESGNLFTITKNSIHNSDYLSLLYTTIVDKGYLITRESKALILDDIPKFKDFNLIAMIPTEEENLILLKRQSVDLQDVAVVKIGHNDTDYTWIGELQTAVKAKHVLIVSDNDQNSGVLGLVNCIRKEPKSDHVTCLVIDDKTAPPFDILNPFYRSHLKLGLAVNFLRNGHWGSYRHLQLIPPTEFGARRDHCFANTLTRGDISSLTWMTGPYNFTRPKNEIVRVCYSSLNFRDVMLASGKLAAEVLDSGRLDQECVLGFEYSGITESGRRVMGMVISGAMATFVGE